jgi:hypothetical protein
MLETSLEDMIVSEVVSKGKLTITTNGVHKAKGQSRNAGTELHLEGYAWRKLFECSSIGCCLRV